MKRALVTGGGGFVGLAIVRQLRKMGVETSVVGRHSYPAVEQAGARCLQGDIRNRDFLEQVVAGHDTVFHVAAKAGIWGTREEFFSINVQGTENVISACRRNGVRSLVHTSTPSVVFDGKDLEDRDETLPYSRNPLCHYAWSKIIAEQKMLEANSENLRTAALRPHLVWGPGDTQIIPRLVKRGRQGELKIVGDGRNLVDISYIDNVAEAHILAANNLNRNATAAGHAFFISQGEPVVLWEWINALFQRIGINAVRKRVSFRTAYRAGQLMELIYSIFRVKNEPKMTSFLAEQLAMSHWFSIARAREILGYEPNTSTAEGLELLVSWIEGQDDCFPGE